MYEGMSRLDDTLVMSANETQQSCAGGIGSGKAHDSYA